MNNTIATAFLSIFCTFTTAILAADYTLDRKVDYRQVLGPHDFVFDEAPTSYADCAFIGNGMIGSTIWARPGEAVHWSGRNDVYSTRQRRGSRLLIGNLSFQLRSPVVSQPMRLSLHKAEASGRVKTEKGVGAMAIHYSAQQRRGPD